MTRFSLKLIFLALEPSIWGERNLVKRKWTARGWKTVASRLWFRHRSNFYYSLKNLPRVLDCGRNEGRHLVPDLFKSLPLTMILITISFNYNFTNCCNKVHVTHSRWAVRMVLIISTWWSHIEFLVWFKEWTLSFIEHIALKIIVFLIHPTNSSRNAVENLQHVYNFIFTFASSRDFISREKWKVPKNLLFKAFRWHISCEKLS